MNYAIVCTSKTGNTKQLADAIQSSLPDEKVIYAGLPQAEALQADRIYVGFWTDKGTCCTEIKDFLKLAKDKEIFLFGTCGFGGSEAYFQGSSNIEMGKKWYENIIFSFIYAIISMKVIY